MSEWSQEVSPLPSTAFAPPEFLVILRACRVQDEVEALLVAHESCLAEHDGLFRVVDGHTARNAWAALPAAGGDLEVEGLMLVEVREAGEAPGSVSVELNHWFTRRRE